LVVVVVVVGSGFGFGYFAVVVSLVVSIGLCLGPGYLAGPVVAFGIGDASSEGDPSLT
jgi:hypothetical protein